MMFLIYLIGYSIAGACIFYALLYLIIHWDSFLEFFHLDKFLKRLK